MENKIIIDSDVLIDFLRTGEKSSLLSNLQEANDIGTTDINAFALYYGAFKSKKQDENLAATKGLLNSLFLASTSEDSMEIAAKVISDLERMGKAIDMRDLFIASICLTNSFKLLTNNRKHFENISGLVLL